MPTRNIAQKCLKFYNQQRPGDGARLLEFGSKAQVPAGPAAGSTVLAAVLCPASNFPTLKTFWQHSGDGISSRQADYCHHLLNEGLLIEIHQAATPNDAIFCKGPRRYRGKSFTSHIADPTNGHANGVPPNSAVDNSDQSRFIEERFGRNLDFGKASAAKLAVRRRIAGALVTNVDLDGNLEAETDRSTMRQVEGFSEDDVYLFPTGMSSIFNSHQALMQARQPEKSIMWGFPYIDTLKILEKFGPGVAFYPRGAAEEMDDLERRLAQGERFLALFCEFPGNPLLTSPDLQRIRELADKYDFAVVVDETIGNFLNVHVLPFADIVVSSLTKVFSGDANVMGGSAISNPQGRYYQALKQVWKETYSDNVWAEDALYLERNSRDFVSRIARINVNAEAICEVLQSHPRIKRVNYPKFSPSRKHYDHCRTPNGGYGGLLSAVFHDPKDAIIFYDNLDTDKGPSLGTNFTLSSPYVILAHYTELDWAASCGVDADLIRFSVGLENTDELKAVFSRALDAVTNQTGTA